MKIELKCKCGDSLMIEDEKGTYINDGGKPDDKGRKFLIEVRADEWREQHRECDKRMKG
uniref:Uncharacterized protein n=1 Tax=viral metagenome TaxID=1070528 RepID=A0A6M3JQZ0_9ZZZZ